MKRPRSLYSPSHDRSASKGPSPRSRKTPVASSETSELGEPPVVPTTFLPSQIPESRRREIRARQLVAEQDRLQGPHALPDHDVNYDPDLEVRDPRGEYFNQVSGPVNTVFPVVRGPQYTHTKTRVLPESDVHPPLPQLDRWKQVSASSPLIAAVSADDAAILEVDNKLTQAHTSLRDLRQAVDRMRESVSRQEDSNRRDGSPTDHASNMFQMLTTIIEPWFDALESEFSGLLEGTEQSSALNSSSPDKEL